MRAMIIFNPNAGQVEGTAADIQAAANVWNNHGWDVDIRPTQGPGDGTRLARIAAASHYDVVLAAGGDGTVNEIINGLAGSETILGALPLGTMNVWVRELKLPLQPRVAAEMLLQSEVRAIDLGRANDRHFLLMAGIGLDAAVTAEVQSKEKQRLGAFAYVLRALDRALGIRGTRINLLLDGKRIKGRVILVVVGNSQLYGGLIKITHRASIDDGLLDVCVIRGNNFWSLLVNFIAIVGRKHSLNPDITYYRARKIDIVAHPALPVQIDGESFGETPMSFEVMPKALKALMPADLPDDLVQGKSASPAKRKASSTSLATYMARQKQV